MKLFNYTEIAFVVPRSGRLRLGYFPPAYEFKWVQKVRTRYDLLSCKLPYNSKEKLHIDFSFDIWDCFRDTVCIILTIFYKCFTYLKSAIIVDSIYLMSSCYGDYH